MNNNNDLYEVWAKRTPNEKLNRLLCPMSKQEAEDFKNELTAISGLCCEIEIRKSTEEK